MKNQFDVQATRSVECITDKYSSHDQLLYFTSSSLTTDDRKLVILSEVDGLPNLFCIDLQTRERIPISNNSDGKLKSYVYFDGLPYRGLGKASVSLDSVRGIVYYIQGKQVIAADLNGNRRILAKLPDDVMTGFTHVSADSTRLCVPTVDAHALDGNRQMTGNHPGFDVDKRIHEENLCSHIRVYDTETGEELVAEQVKGGWVTHVQFSPLDNQIILYNHEWCSDSGIRRMWLWDGFKHKQIRDESQGRSRADWACHEMWERDGSAIIYHGAYDQGPGYVGRYDIKSGQIIEVPFNKEYKKYGHFTVGDPGMLVSDGYFQLSDDTSTSWGGEWITIQLMNWDRQIVRWTPICKHGSSWKSQDEHPHPIINHGGNMIYFTSDISGRRAVYRINISY